MNSVIEKFLREGNNVNKFSRIFAEQQAPMPLIYPIIKMNPEGVKLLLDAEKAAHQKELKKLNN